MRPREPASAPTPALESGEKSENPSSEGSWESRRGGRRVFDSVDDTRPSTRGLRGKLPRDAAEHVGNSASGRSAAVQGDDTAGVGSEKHERRRQQLREASRRHRMRKRSAAQKTENELKQRTAEVNALRSELERHQRLLRSSVASQDQTLRSQVAQLQHQNEELQRENQTLRAALPDGRLTKDLLHILRAPLEDRSSGAALPFQNTTRDLHAKPPTPPWPAGRGRPDAPPPSAGATLARAPLSHERGGWHTGGGIGPARTDVRGASSSASLSPLAAAGAPPLIPGDFRDDAGKEFSLADSRATHVVGDARSADSGDGGAATSSDPSSQELSVGPNAPRAPRAPGSHFSSDGAGPSPLSNPASSSPVSGTATVNSSTSSSTAAAAAVAAAFAPAGSHRYSAAMAAAAAAAAAAAPPASGHPDFSWLSYLASPAEAAEECAGNGAVDVVGMPRPVGLPSSFTGGPARLSRAASTQGGAPPATGLVNSCGDGCGGGCAAGDAGRAGASRGAERNAALSSTLQSAVSAVQDNAAPADGGGQPRKRARAS